MLTIIGCGNPTRRDDGVGVAVAQRLQHRLQRHPVPGVQVFDCGTAGVDVMFKARGSEALVIVDAAQTGAEPGSIFEVPGEELAADYEASLSLHDFRWENALAAGRRIFKDQFPREVRVWLVEAESVGYGIELSAPAERAMETVYGRLLRVVADHAARRHSDRVEGIPLRIERGSIHIEQAVYERFFDGRQGVLLMAKDSRVALVPIDQTDGGLIVKQRNAKGDRVIHAVEHLMASGIGPEQQHELMADWDPRLGAVSFVLPKERLQ